MRRSVPRTITLSVALSLAAVVGAAATSPVFAAAAGTPPLAVSATQESRQLEVLTPAHCLRYLNAAGYPSETEVVAACDAGDSGEAGAYGVCYSGLISWGVTEFHADWACKLAAQ
jgi:hypothetical protein